MREVLRRLRGGALPACVAFVLIACAVFAASANAASSSERAVPLLQACLDGELEKWVSVRAELVVNEDPRAGDVDDAAVAKWALETLQACRLQAGGGDQSTETGFTKRIAQWRQHIYDRVQSIRELVRPD